MTQYQIEMAQEAERLQKELKETLTQEQMEKVWSLLALFTDPEFRTS